MKLAIPDNILGIDPYVPGKPIAAVEREYGIRESIKLASNENPLGPSPLAVAAIRKALSRLHRYPDGGGFELIERLSARFKTTPAHVVLGNGSDEIIGMLTTAFLRPGDQAILSEASFLMYEIMVRCAGATPVRVPLKSFGVDLDGMLANINSSTRMVFVNNPHNPTGTVITRLDFEQFLERLPSDIIVVLDEAYIEFVRDTGCPVSTDYVDSGHAVAGLRTFSKAYGLAGIRIGYGIMPPPVADVLNRVRQPFNVNLLAQEAAIAALEDKAFLQETLRLVHTGLDDICTELDRLGLAYQPSQTNFVLIAVNRPAERLFEALLRRGIIVRPMNAYGFPEHIRVNVGLPDENHQMIAALETELGL